MRVYICGKMSGLPSFNYDAFHHAALRLRAAGWDVLNPADNFGGDQTQDYAAYMRQAVIDLLSVNTVALLRGWEASKGAQMEVAVAAQLGLRFIDATTQEHLRLRFDGIQTTAFTGAPPLIAITGKLKSGKTALAEALMAEHHIPRGAFAASLKDGARAMGLETDGPNKDRECLQRIGTDVVRRHKGVDHWVRVFAARYHDMRATGLVVDDCRFKNEYDYLKSQGFIMIRLVVSPETQIARGADPSTLTHESETALDHIPHCDFDIATGEQTSVAMRKLRVFSEMARRRMVAA